MPYVTLIREHVHYLTSMFIFPEFSASFLEYSFLFISVVLKFKQFPFTLNNCLTVDDKNAVDIKTNTKHKIEVSQI